MVGPSQTGVQFFGKIQIRNLETKRGLGILVNGLDINPRSQGINQTKSKYGVLGFMIPTFLWAGIPKNYTWQIFFYGARARESISGFFVSFVIVTNSRNLR